MNWGASAVEASGEVAGDELMPHANIVATRVVEIDAPPSAIWSWLVQMGPERGGAYTYDWIERRLGVDIHNVDRVVAELQNLKLGDEIPMPGYAMRVERLDKEQAMVIRSSNGAWVWSFELRPTNGHTRLISRNRFDTSAWTAKGLARVPRHGARVVADGAEDAAHDQAARRTSRPDTDPRMSKPGDRPSASGDRSRHLVCVTPSEAQLPPTSSSRGPASQVGPPTRSPRSRSRRRPDRERGAHRNPRHHHSRPGRSGLAPHSQLMQGRG